MMFSCETAPGSQRRGPRRKRPKSGCEDGESGDGRQTVPDWRVSGRAAARRLECGSRLFVPGTAIPRFKSRFTSQKCYLVPEF